MAEHAPTTSRRSLLAAGPAAMVLTGTGIAGAVQAAAPNRHTATLAQPDPDAAILALGRRFQAIEVEYIARTEPYYDDTPEPEENRARVYVLVAEGHRIAEELADMQATTLAGLRVKAAALMHYTCFEADGDVSWTNHDDLMGWSLARDLLAGGA